MITGSTTTNLHQLVASFYHPHGKRTKILVDELNFPSDLYAISSQLSLHGYNPEEHMKFVKSHDGNTLLEEDIIESMTDDIALIVLPSVLYRSGQILNLKALTKAAHERNIIETASSQGIVVSIGHSDASSEEVEKAVKLGVKQATHL